MDATTLIRQVEECRRQRWKDSDLSPESERRLEAIADHLAACEECRADFDAMEYPETVLIDFERRLVTTTIEEWICEGGA